MILLTPIQRYALRANSITHRAAQAADRPEPDPAPVIKSFLSCGAATWLASELDADGDTVFGFADLGFGCPELGSFSLREIASVRLPFGLFIERDLDFTSTFPLSIWADIAHREGSIREAEALLSGP